jgi:hypothetical protein
MTTKKKPQSKGNIYDTFVKQMFGRILVFIDFLIHYADPGFVAEIDLRKIKPAPTHYIGKGGDERIVDLVFQCPLKNGKGTMIAVIIFEHQSGSLKEIPRKLHKYISAIWDTEKKESKKILSLPYFIVLRTGKKPLKGPPPQMSDSFPKGLSKKLLEHVPEIQYNLVDLPAWDFRKLIGGPVLRLALGMLKKMIEGAENSFSEAMLPLREIDDEEQKVELTKELLQFAAKAFAAHNRRLDAETVNNAINPVFKDKVQTMIKTIFEEKFDEGVAVGKARGKAEGKAEGKIEAVLKFLRARFKKIPKSVENSIRQMTDPIALDSWAEHAATCQSMDEFAKALK